MNRARRTTTPTSFGVVIGTGNGGCCGGAGCGGGAGRPPQRQSAIYRLGCNEPTGHRMTGHRKSVAKAGHVVVS